MSGAEKDDDQSSHHHVYFGSTIYTCPMHPEVRSTSPGTCPKCGMKLVPIAMTEHGMDHHEHAMKPASKMSCWERFRMSMTMTMGMEHTGVAGREMARLMELDIRNKFFFALVLSVPIILYSPLGKFIFGIQLPAPLSSSLASLPTNDSGLLLLRLDLHLLELQSSSAKNADHVSSDRNGNNRRVQLQRSPHCSAERRFLLRSNRSPHHLRLVWPLVGDEISTWYN